MRTGGSTVLLLASVLLGGCAGDEGLPVPKRADAESAAAEKIAFSSSRDGDFGHGRGLDPGTWLRTRSQDMAARLGPGTWLRTGSGDISRRRRVASLTATGGAAKVIPS
jgi:hypothetical protein